MATITNLTVKPRPKWWVTDINNLSDPKQYQKAIRYVKLRIKIAKWIWVKHFASPDEIMAEVFLKFHEDKILNYDADILCKYIYRVITNQWKDYCTGNPRIRAAVERHQKKYLKAWKVDARSSLNNWYIAKLLSESGLNGEDITLDRIKEKRAEVTAHRNRTCSIVCGNGKTYTIKEDEFLRSEYSHSTVAEIAQQIKRTNKSVEKRLKRLGIKKIKPDLIKIISD